MSNGVSFQQGMFHFADCEPAAYADAPHFLESCFLCRKPLARSSDIFMYRGSTPFCSAECREEQIVSDESKEERNRRKMCASARSSMSSSQTINKVQVHVA